MPHEEPAQQRAVVVLGTLDTKGAELTWMRDRLAARGVATLLVDVGLAEPAGAVPDVDRHAVARETGADADALRAAGDRGAAVAAMADAATALLARLHAEGRLAGVLSAGGTGNTAIAAQAMRALPIGIPKLCVSTVAAGDTGPYVGGSDLILVPSVTDVAGLNRISMRILANATDAMAGMVTGPPVPQASGRRLIGASMFGVTTPAVDCARAALEARGYEVLVFHATGVGGRAMERLVADGLLDGLLDLTTTELCDELVGGVLSAGPDRLRAAARAGLPQVVSVGAVDMVNFGPRETVPERFADRTLFVHNPTVTLMRTTAEECAELGRRIAERLSETTGPASLFLPLRGVSMIDADGQPFRDAAADAALFGAIREHLDRRRVELVELDLHVNDDAFATAMAQRLDALLAAPTNQEHPST
jgi:uncharacterized protein (UPF0261 family)